MDMDVVFAPRKEPLIPPRYQLMTRDQLQEAHTKTVAEAEQLLQMTPVLPGRAWRGETLKHDQELDGFLDNCMIFTDISMNKESKDRSVLVREPSGVLRDATWEERDRMMQVYFPSLGRKMWLPHMLTDEGLIPVLEAEQYRNILEVACLQCEPDSTDYIRVHCTVYDRIEKEGAYDALRSTRHFGGLVWYLVRQEKMVGLIKDVVQRKLRSDGEALVQLYLLCHPQSPLATSGECAREDKGLLEAFCRHFALGGLLAQLPSTSTARQHSSQLAI
jgi:small subunit ribosomal protein S22